MSLLHRKKANAPVVTPAPGDPGVVVKTRIGTNADGSAHYHYASRGHAVITGPISGTVTLADGTEYDVSEPIIAVASAEHAAEVADLIGRRHEAEGHPHHTDPSKPFRHTPRES